MPETTPAPGRYDLRPEVRVPDARGWQGDQVWPHLLASARERDHDRPVVVIDAYPGVEVVALIKSIASHLPEAEVLDLERWARPEDERTAMLTDDLTDDRVFGWLRPRAVDDFYREGAFDEVATVVDQADRPLVVVGWGAARVAPDRAVVVLADMPRWEIQTRQRAGQPSWRCSNDDEDTLRKYKRGFFIEWRTADAHKRPLLHTVDFVLDTVTEPALVSGDDYRRGLELTTRRPFRVVPFFDPGVWGGQWMRERFGLDESAPNYAWCFDCVPEENSLLLRCGDVVVETPSINLVLHHPVPLLGARTHARFGAEFPIRFDLLDTMGGGNLSLQVHPLTDYIQRTFGMHYTQDESYYLLDADPGAVVHLGLRTGVDPAQMAEELRRASRGEQDFDAERFVNSFPAAKHDHFPIPAGTVHCSGANSMVLEISATPFIFTFKMWDWGRLGLDGLPRPVHLDHALANIQWDRQTEWTTTNLVGQVEQVGSGDGWVAERTGLHELEFIETTRHWFTSIVEHDTAGTVNVLNLVEGDEAVVESPTGAFEPFVVHHAETFIVPAALGRYTIRPTEAAAGQRCGTIKAHVRGTTT
ncbi:class I mannose-6-phosphate isomerase [Aestuariimicrobium ganziense]|uniref:class I mannose-6-phosphate isomerase n=1 Tax=Aestuariimicrobium ganziense TaxID=2773677 RepID=UPI0019457AD9|nr:class I mannose-6-phosphate isomerase [Aestuariimicrobium ganziense]